MVNHIVVLTVLTVLGFIPLIGFARPAHAQGAGLYMWAGLTSQGEQLELSASPGPDPDSWSVSSVRLTGAIVKCQRSTEDLDLSPFAFETDTEIVTAPVTRFTIGRLTTDDEQVALVITGQAVAYNQIRVNLTVYWTHLFYRSATETIPVSERCSVVLSPVMLQLIAID